MRFIGACFVVVLATGCGDQAVPPVGSPHNVVPPPPPPPGDAFSRQSFPAPLSVADAEQILLRTTWFEIGGMPPKRQVQAYNRIFDQPNARELLESIATRAETAGRLYALSGLIATQSDKAANVERELLARREPLHVFDSDVVAQKTPSDLVQLIRTRKLWDEFRRGRVEARVHFDKDALMSAADRQATIEAYQEAIALAGTSGGFMEHAFNALRMMADALMQAQDGKSAIEALTDDDFGKLQKTLPGAVIFRQEIVGVKPDAQYFARLAAAHGDAADRAFFAALSASRSESIWPVYLERQTDYSGCTRYGSLTLVRAYRDWSTFLDNHPGRYVQAATEELDEVSRQLTDATCACGNAASVRTELERFIRDFAAAPIRSKVEQRLDEVKAGRSTMRMNCVSG